MPFGDDECLDLRLPASILCVPRFPGVDYLAIGTRLRRLKLGLPLIVNDLDGVVKQRK